MGFILFIAILELNLCRVSYALTNSNYRKFESTSSSGYSEVSSETYLNQILNLRNIIVNFSQDDTEYIFHVTGNAEINVFKDVVRTTDQTSGSPLLPMFYKTANFGRDMQIIENSRIPFASFRTGSLYADSKVKILGKTIEYYNYAYTLRSDGSVVANTDEYEYNGDRYYIPNNLRFNSSAYTYNFKNVTTYPIRVKHNGGGVRIIQNSSYYYFTTNDEMSNNSRYVDMYYANINVKFAIEKSYIDHYRYVCIAQNYFVRSSEYLSEVRHQCSGVSICSQTIDLKDHVVCEHEWEIQEEDRYNHRKKCKNCAWEISEPHNLVYEYDGIKNNICTCSYIDKVNYNFIINDDYTSEVKEQIETDSIYTKYEFRNKKGYTFRHYNAYEKQLMTKQLLSTDSNAVKKVLLATISTLPEKAGRTSMTFEAVYRPNTFTIHYSNENSKDILFEESIDSQKVVYDEEACLKDNLNYIGYVFKGWSTLVKGESIDFAAKQDIKNYTDIDLYELTLYPVYASMDFKIAYSAGGGTLSDGSKYKEVKYTYYDESELEKVYSNSSEEYFLTYVDDLGNRYSKMSEVKKYVADNELENTVVNLFPIFTRNAIGKAERTKDETKESLKKPENVEIVETEVMPEDIIYGMSDTTALKKDKSDSKKAMRGEIIASLSFIEEYPPSDDNVTRKNDKFAKLLLWIKNNVIAFSIGSFIYFGLLVAYEIFIIKKYKKRI